MPIPEVHQPETEIIPFPESFDSLEPAPTSLRLGAFLIDFSIIHSISLWGAQWLGLLLLRILTWENSTNKKLLLNEQAMAASYHYVVYLLWPLFLLFIGFAYYTVCLSRWRCTLGKGICGIQVVPTYGERLPTSLENIGRRYLASLCSIFTFGILFLLGSSSYSGICFHDEVSSTRVVRKNKRTKIRDDAATVVSVQRAA